MWENSKDKNINFFSFVCDWMRGDLFFKKIVGFNVKKYFGILLYYIGNCLKYKEYLFVNFFVVVFYMIKKVDFF